MLALVSFVHFELPSAKLATPTVTAAVPPSPPVTRDSTIDILPTRFVSSAETTHFISTVETIPVRSDPAQLMAEARAAVVANVVNPLNEQLHAREKMSRVMRPRYQTWQPVYVKTAPDGSKLSTEHFPFEVQLVSTQPSLPQKQGTSKSVPTPAQVLKVHHGYYSAREKTVFVRNLAGKYVPAKEMFPPKPKHSV